jgi:hypothetical protein
MSDYIAQAKEVFVALASRTGVLRAVYTVGRAAADRCYCAG